MKDEEEVSSGSSFILHPFEEEIPMAPPVKPGRLIKSYSMPVDAAVFKGVPSVTALKLVPSANVLLAAAMDRRVVSCDLAAEAPRRIAAKHLAWAHDNWVHSLDVHPDGARVATGGIDRKIKLWKWGLDLPLADFKAHDDCVRSLAFSPDGKRLASAGDDGRVKLWEVETAKPLTTLNAEGRFLDTLAWTVDGKQLLCSGHDGKMHIWDAAAWKLIRSIDIDNRRNIEDEPLNGGFSYPGGIRRLTTSPDGKSVAAVGLTSLHVLDLASGKETLNQAGRGFGVAFDPHSKKLAFSQEKDLVVWDFPAAGITHRIVVDQLGLFGICFLKDGQQLASGGCNGWVGLWDLTA
jgi:WD40 repeat protein